MLCLNHLKTKQREEGANLLCEWESARTACVWHVSAATEGVWFVFLYFLPCLSVSKCNAIQAQLLHRQCIRLLLFLRCGCLLWHAKWLAEESGRVHAGKEASGGMGIYSAAKYIQCEMKWWLRRAHTLSYFKIEKGTEKRKLLYCSESAVSPLCNAALSA
jgi:hypothetical protein